MKTQVAPQEGRLSQAYSAIGGAVQQAATEPGLKKGFDMQVALKTGWDTIQHTVSDLANRITEAGATINDPKKSLGEKVISEARLGVGLINTAFLTVTAPLEATRGVPVIGHAADLAHNILSGVFSGFGETAGQAVDASPLPQKTKDKLRPLAFELAGLIGLGLTGKVGGTALGQVKTKAKAFSDELNSGLSAYRSAVEGGASQLPKDISVQGAGVETPIPFANRYEVPTIIQMGVKPKDILPVIQSPAEWKAAGMPSVAPKSAPTAPITPKVDALPTPESRVVPLGEESTKTVTPQKTGEVTKVASDISDTLVQQGFDALSPEVQSKYTPESYKAELVRAKELAETNYKDASARATGQKPVGDYEGQILFNEVEKVATKAGDAETLMNLASSPLGKARSLAGQTLGASGFNKDPNSPVQVMQDIQSARAATMKTRGVDVPKETVKEVASMKREVVESVKGSRPKWEDFIKEITCGY